MRSLLSLGVISSFVYACYCQLEENGPTHIIKFKTSSLTQASLHQNDSTLFVKNMIMSHHQNFLMSVRNIQVQKNNDTFSASAATYQNDLSLDQISIGQDFVAVSGVFSDHKFLDYLGEQPTIEYVEENQLYKTTQVQMQSAIPANWGLARIRQHERGDLGQYDYDPMGGHGVDVYVLDTGVYIDHLDFNGRASHSANMIKHEDNYDMGGHGTHVSGKIIGQAYGVAKSANVKSVKILNKNGDGTTSGLLKGIEHVIQNARPGKSLVNLSLSGPKSRVLDDALNSLVLQYGVPVFVSAGNAGTDACFFSPSSNTNVFAVGAIDIEDKVPYFSNVGECVSIYAPGSSIVSSYIGGSDSSKSMDGTSMASPHVAGIAANLMSKYDFGSAHEVYNAIKSFATKDVLFFDSSKSSSPNNNLLAFNEL